MGHFPTTTTTNTNTNMNTTPDQTRAIKTRAEQALIIAGPGSGKTTVLVERIAHILTAQPDTADQMVAITFTNEAGKNLLRRLETKIPNARLDYVGTLHGYALRELMRHGASLGYRAKITIMDEAQSLRAMSEARSAIGTKTPATKLLEARQGRTIQDKARTPQELAIRHYLGEMRRQSCVDFEAILTDFLELAKAGKTAFIRHLLVDEFQDSAPIDVRIYDALCAQNRFYVGDPDQAIYSFRGGSLAAILAKARDPEWEVTKLEGNFRCALRICAAANELIQNNHDRIPKLTFPMSDETGTTTQESFMTDDAEIVGVLRLVHEAVKAGTPADEIAVLARTNRIARAFAEMAEASGVIARQKMRNPKPQDWRYARAALDLMADPRSQRTQYAFLVERDGEPAAREALKAMRKAMDSDLSKAVRTLYPDDMTVEQAPQAMARIGISGEAIEWIRRTADEIPNPTLSSLCFAIARDEHVEREIGGGVTFTTIHGAKGREWDTVVLAGMEQGTCPGTSKSRDVEEERRLAFVGITRARRTLLITHAKARRASWGQQRHEPQEPSQFIAEAQPQA